ncbi:ribonuclease H-like domain-containing protein [Tanacetum coccineum]
MTIRTTDLGSIFFDQLCSGYDVLKFIRGTPTDATTTSASIPFTSDELKVDKIILSCIFTTIFDPLQKGLVVARPNSAKEAWDLLTNIVKDNKRTRASTLKTELRSIQLGALSMEAYFQKIESLVTTLTSLDCVVNDEDVVHYAIDGLPDKYNQVCGYMHYQNTFPDLKMMRSLLVAEEMCLKSKVNALPVDSSSNMVLMAQSGDTRRPTNPQVKSWKPCFNFTKGTCRFGEKCRYVHDTNMRSNTNISTNSTSQGSTVGKNNENNTMHALLNKLIKQIGNLNVNTLLATNSSRPTDPMAYSIIANPPTGPFYLAHNTPPGFPPLAPAQAHTIPPGFTPLAPAQAYYYYSGPTVPTAPDVQYHYPVVGPAQQGHAQPTSGINSGLIATPGQATTLPAAFTTGTLHDPTTGAWNMDSGATSHLNNSVNCLGDIFNTCLYSSISVGDGHSIPVTNSGHSVLPNPLRSLHLNNVLITPHIVKNLIYVRQFVRDNNCTVEFDAFAFSVKYF